MKHGLPYWFKLNAIDSLRLRPSEYSDSDLWMVPALFSSQSELCWTLDSSSVVVFNSSSASCLFFPGTFFSMITHSERWSGKAMLPKKTSDAVEGDIWFQTPGLGCRFTKHKLQTFSKDSVWSWWLRLRVESWDHAWCLQMDIRNTGNTVCCVCRSSHTVHRTVYSIVLLSLLVIFHFADTFHARSCLALVFLSPSHLPFVFACFSLAWMYTLNWMGTSFCRY